MLFSQNFYIFVLSNKTNLKQKGKTMTITTKLAVDFVKRNFNSFACKPLIKASEVTSLNVYDAHVKIGYTDVKLFDLDTYSTSCTMVLLPEKLCSKLGFEEALKLIDKEDMNMENYLHDKTKYVRVTTNRLLMLEKLMKKSGFINTINQDAKNQTRMFEEYIKNLINEKRPGFLQKYANTDDVIKLYEPEILSVLDDIANCVIEYVEKRS